MSNVLVDKTRDELDFLSQAVEPFVDPLLDILSEAPKAIVHDWSMVKAYGGISSSVRREDLEADRLRILARYLESPHLKAIPVNHYDVPHPATIVTNFRRGILKDSYKLIFPVGSKLNLFTGIAYHEDGEQPRSVFIEPAMLTQPNSVGTSFMEFTCDLIGQHMPRTRNASEEQLSRAVEIAKLLDIEYQSKRNLTATILSGLRDKISKDTWKLRSLLPIAQINYWVASYIIHGQLNNFVNLTHFKVMTHSGNAIYELSEVV